MNNTRRTPRTLRVVAVTTTAGPIAAMALSSNLQHKPSASQDQCNLRRGRSGTRTPPVRAWALSKTEQPCAPVAVRTPVTDPRTMPIHSLPQSTITGNGSNGIPNGTLFTGTFSAPADLDLDDIVQWYP